MSEQIITLLIGKLKQALVFGEQCTQGRLRPGPEARTAVMRKMQILRIVVANEQNELLGFSALTLDNLRQVVENRDVIDNEAVGIIAQKNDTVVPQKSASFQDVRPCKSLIVSIFIEQL